MFTTGGTVVEIHFLVDKDQYIIQRFKDHKKYKTDLKIFINGDDKSGKGIRDSQKLLESYLPDLTSSLIGSVIILGQGLPQRFTNNTPAGRKEVLEKLSKSDFMIEDLKIRLQERKSYLSTQLREAEDSILVNETKIKTLKSQIEQAKDKLDSLDSPVIYDDLISRASRRKGELKVVIDDLSKKVEEVNLLIEDINRKKLSITNEYNDRVSTINSKVYEVKSSYEPKIIELEQRVKYLRKEIIDAKSIKDSCPTCGRKFDNVFIPDTSEKEIEVSNIVLQIDDLRANMQKDISIYDEQKRKVVGEMNSIIDGFDLELSKNKSHKYNYESGISGYRNEYSNEDRNISRYESLKSNYETTVRNINETISYNTNQIEKLNQEIVYNNVDKDAISERIGIVNKFTTLTNRDFRGYLLKNVIKFIDKRAKEYCKDVFGTDEIDFTLEGNNIDIKYCGKYMESLSGGEKQKIDLIIQFSIRDMLCQFLDFRSNLIALDEIFDALDSVSCDKVVDLISRKLSDIDSVFIITHHKELGIPSDSVITVTKHSDGVSVVC